EADARFQIIGPEPEAPCQQCGRNDGQVFMIRNNFARNIAAQPLHEGKCARKWFGLEEPEPPLQSWEIEDLGVRGFSGNDLFDMKPSQARAPSSPTRVTNGCTSASRWELKPRSPATYVSSAGRK